VGLADWVLPVGTFTPPWKDWVDRITTIHSPQDVELVGSLSMAIVKLPTSRRRKPVSGPALVVLGLVLAGIWFGSRSLSQSGSFSVDGGAPTVASQSAPSPEPSIPEQPASAASATDQVASPASTPSEPSALHLPDGYPSALPTPSDSTLTAVTGAKGDRQASYVVSYSVLGPPAVVSQRYRDQLTTAGFTVDDQAAFAGPGGETLLGATRDTIALTVTLSANPASVDSTVLTINAVVE
jgi:hypothetical protein